jgi:hypothetical protein
MDEQNHCAAAGHRIVARCMTCLGARGGQARTPKKIRASRRNVKAARRTRHLEK